jgi:hypothetical protein
MNCSVCGTINPDQANYCFKCGTKTAQISKHQFSLGVPDEIASLPSFGYWIVRKIPMPYWISMIIFWQIITAIDFFMMNHFGGPDQLIFMSCLYLTFSSTMVVIEYTNRQMQRFFPRLITFVDAPQEIITEWYRKSLTTALFSKTAFIVGVSFAIVGSITTYEILVTKSGGVVEVITFRVIANGLGFFFQGVGMWGIISIIRMCHRLSNFKINVQLFAVGNDSVMALGNVFLRISLAVTAVYALFVLSDIVGGLYHSQIIIFWNVVAVLFILSFFIIPQYRIHKLMVQEKQLRLKAFSSYLESSVNECLHQPSKEKLDHLKGLFELKEHLSQMHEWSFRTRSISQLISVLLIPLLLVILEVYLSR